MKEKRITPGFILGIFLVLAFIIGIITIKDYGPSFDEPILYQYAKFLPSTYIKAAFQEPIDGIFEFGDKFVRYYGTAYLIIGELLNQGLMQVTRLDVYQRWHILNLAVFLVGVWGLYWLIKKMLSKEAALFASVLYLSQPLLWGHAIMNPKDTPFASLFILSIAAGVKMVEEIRRSSGEKKPIRAITTFLLKKWYGYFLWVPALVFFLDRTINHFITRPILQSFFQLIGSSADNSPIKSFILAHASNFENISAETYIQKFLHQIGALEFFWILVFCLVLLTLFLLNSSASQRWVLFSGVLLGITTSVRTLGPAAGALVLLYLFSRIKFKRAIFPAIGYGLTACLATYGLWPFLWANPISRFVEAFSVMANFPWLGTVRFEGKDVLASNLPWNYLPKLMGIQFTLPLVILAIAGTYLIIKEIAREKSGRELNIVILLWFYIPFITWMIIKPNTYDNFRQFLFIVPPLFIFATAAFEAIRQKTTYKMLLPVLAIAAILPGIIEGFLIHPFEYIYYNSLVGWTQNIERHYEADYYATSLCETAKILDPVIGETSKVAFTNSGLSELFQSCSEKKPVILIERSEISKVDPDYSVILTRWDDDLDYFREMKPYQSVMIGKTPLIVIKEAIR